MASRKNLLFAARDDDRIGGETSSIRDGILSLQPILASPFVPAISNFFLKGAVGGREGRCQGVLKGGGGGGELEGGGPVLDHAGVLGDVEAAEEDNFCDDDEGHNEGQ